MSIEPKIEKTDDDIAAEERSADRPSSTAEVARDLERSEPRNRADAEEGGKPRAREEHQPLDRN